jgi:hypothetical protein
MTGKVVQAGVKCRAWISSKGFVELRGGKGRTNRIIL